MQAEIIELHDSLNFLVKDRGRDPIRVLPGGTEIHPHPAVHEFIAKHPYMVPTANGVVYLSKYDKRAFERIRNLLGPDLTLVPCTHDVIVGLIQKYRSSENSNDRSEPANNNGADHEMVQLFRMCLREGISDLHILARKSEVTLLRRIHGELHPLDSRRVYEIEDINRICRALVNFVSHDSGGQSKDNFKPNEWQDAQFTLPVDGKEINIRYAHVPVSGGIDVVLRLLAGGNTGRVDLDRLGYPDDILNLIERVNKLPNGIILCTGETGAGKTTVLAGMLSQQPSTLKMYSYEEPVEIKLANVSQVPVNTNSEVMSWEPLAQNTLRLDPNIIFYGEIRSAEVAEAAIKAASTGHLVYSTLHTNDAPGAVQRLIDLGVDQRKLAIPNMIRFIMSQKLIPKICVNCSISFDQAHLTPKDDQRIREYFSDSVDYLKFRGNGCHLCNGLGIHERQVIAEVVFVDRKGREYIRNADISGWYDYLKKMGWVSMQERAEKYIREGIFDPLLVEQKLGANFGIDEDEFHYPKSS